MARKTKYFFNPKSLSFERVRDNRSYMIWRGIGFSSLILVLSLMFAVIFSRMFAPPRERSLLDENASLRRELKGMERSVNELERNLGVLKERDLKIYRAMYEADPPKPVDYRGPDYNELRSLPEGELLQRIRQKIDRLGKEAYAQAVSYETLKRLIRSKE
jgi:hypothetical protein